IGKLYLIPDAPLRHIDDAPRHDLAHSTGIGRPGALAFRLEEPVPGLIEGRTKYINGFGIEVRLRSDQINNAGHPRTPTPKRRRRIAAGNFHVLACDDSIPRAEMSSSRFILAEPERAAALSGNRDIRVRLHRIGSAGGTCAHARGANTAAKQALDVAGTSIKR